MSLPIEDYALLGDTRALALASKHGSIDWLCVPRPDSAACFAALLGDEKHGRFRIAPSGDESYRVARRYREGTMTLETDFVCTSGKVRLVDTMLPAAEAPVLVRVVEGLEGSVELALDLVIRFDYGWVVPWVRTVDGALRAVGGPDALVLYASVETHGKDLTTVARFRVSAGERAWFVLAWHASNVPPPPPIDPYDAIARSERYWRAWIARSHYDGPWREAVERSLLTLKALTYSPTGAIIAAATTSLPEQIGSVRNWDYRYSWLRDATFTLYAFLVSGFHDEARAWRDWLLRAIAGSPAQLQIMYGVAGERRLPEMTLDWLPGYEGSRPVRIGNDAVHQFQLDVYGEVLDALHLGRRAQLPLDPNSWQLENKLLEFLESRWRDPDAGLWEMRGPPQHFTHSKVMAWVGFDRAVKAVQRVGLEGPIARWQALRDEIHAEVIARAYDAARGTFTQAYDSAELDAALLMLPLVGFLPAKDPRIVGTVAAIERELMRDGFVLRYRSEASKDGLPPGEGVFLLCSFWLADNYALIGAHDKALALFDRLLALRNDVGLLAEEFDPHARRFLGNFPQAFSHVGLINTAFNLTPRQVAPARERHSEHEREE